MLLKRAIKVLDHSLAVKDFNKAIDLNPNDADYYNNRGKAYHLQKKYDLAINEYSKAIDLNPNNAAYYNNRGKAYQELENKDLARDSWQQAAQIYQRLGDDESYRRILESINNLSRSWINNLFGN